LREQIGIAPVQSPMKRIRFALCLLAALTLCTRAFGLGLIVIQEQDGWRPPIIIQPPIWPRPPRPPVQRHPFAPLELASAKVSTTIKDQVATTSIEQEFFNPNPVRLEGTFLFPVPKGAHLDKFRMEIDGKFVEAELLAADKARSIYEGIVRSMRDPALLEYAGQDVFKVRIFPIEPNSRKRVALSFTQLLKSDSGLVTYSLPLGTQKYSAAPVKNVSVKVELETARPLKAVYSPSHKVEVRRDGERRATAGFEGADVAPDADFTLYFSAEQDAIGLSLLTQRQSGEDGYFLLLASPGADTKDAKPMPKDVAFVLDTSGSMAGKKLEQAKKALQFCVENLAAGDRFEVIRFSTEAEALFNALTEANTANRAKASDWVTALKPIGGTAIDEALKRSLSLRPGKSERPFVVIFLTDGMPTVGTTDEKEIVARVKREAGSTRVFVFGIGTDVNTHLLDKIAEESRAFAQYVLPEEDIEVKVSNFFAKIRDPILANPTLNFTGDIRVSKLYPTPLPDLFRGDQMVLVGRYSGRGDSAATLEGSVNGTPRKFAQDVKFPETASDSEFIPRLWATRRVGYLLDEIRLRGENSELKEEVTDLARKYGIVTPYTAYLIVEDEARRGVAVNVQTLPGLQADALSRAEVSSAYQAMSRDKTGGGAVAGARYGLALRQAESPAQATVTLNAEANRQLWAAAPAPSGLAGGVSVRRDNQAASRAEQYSQQQRFVAGRTFVQNGARWVDSQVQQQKAGGQRVQVSFGSTDYFSLVRQHPEAAPWLALGQNVDLVLGGVIYEVSEAAAESGNR
jgi:Ca-activated chloride channel family protein